MRPILLLLVVLAPATALAQTADDFMLHIQSFRYIPDPLTVRPGATVYIMSFPDPDKTPEETEPHSVTSSTDRSLFDVTNIPADGSAHPFTAPSTPGTYPYYCIYHGDKDGNGMAGTLIVQESAAATPTPSASPTPTPSPSPTPTAQATPADTPLPAWAALAALALGAVLVARKP